MMSSLTICFDYITGRSVAAAVSDRDAAEWPPHPGRIFMALAAACFEMGEDEKEVAALQWLESLPPPTLSASDADERSAVAVYVPVNDKVTVSKSLLQSVPGLSRPKQERSFPTVIPHDTVVKLTWQNVDDVESHLEAISSICSNVIRVGHSSSLVRAWATTDSKEIESVCWYPQDGVSEMRVRVAGPGEFNRLRIACKSDQIDQFAELIDKIETSSGKKKKEAKAEFEATFNEPYKNSVRPPEPTPPVIGTWQGYARTSELGERKSTVVGEHFDSQLLILSKIEGRSLGVEDTLTLTSRLRDTAMSYCDVQPPPAWLSGHAMDGKATKEPHMAFLALPYVGGSDADGHLLGLALALPMPVPPEQRGQRLSRLLVDDDGNSKDVVLNLGRLGQWNVRLEERNSPPQSLQNGTWAGPADCWASVTPVVLDRFPKNSRADERAAWHNEVAETIALSCERAGLPRPLQIDIDTTSWHEGSPRAVRKKRKLRTSRGQSSPESQPASLGNGFPAMPTRPGKPSRPQVHVCVHFGNRVLGPVILGAGRFLGYGLCKPYTQRRQPSS